MDKTLPKTSNIRPNKNARKKFSNSVFGNLKVMFTVCMIFFLYRFVELTPQTPLHTRHLSSSHQQQESYVNDVLDENFYDDDLLPMEVPKSFPNTGLTKVDSKNDYIYLNTIDGQFCSIGKHDGKIRWSIKEDDILKIPKNYENPYFLTDPRDGSLYIFTNKKEGLKKFPYTIAELVSASPSKSSDGYLFTGDKKDQWIAIDYRSGYKLDTLTSDTLGSSSKISLSGADSTSGGDSNILFIGRTKYTLSMFDMSTRKKTFNLTYYDYSTHTTTYNMNSQNKSNKNSEENLDDSIKDDSTEFPLNKANTEGFFDPYQYYHFTSSSDGTLITLDKKTGELIWQLKLETPIIGMYRYENDQLFKLNFAVFAAEALTNQNPDRYKLLYLEQKYQEKLKLISNSLNKNRNIDSHSSSNLFAYTLYIGFYKNNLYALPALIYNWQIPGIEGPQMPSPTLPKPLELPYPTSDETGLSNPTMPPNSENNPNTLALKETHRKDKNKHSIKIGHHKIPEKFKPPPNYIQTNTKYPFFDGVKEKSVPKAGDDDNQDFLEIIGVNLNGEDNTPKPPVCELSSDTSMSGPFKKASLSLWKKFDQLMQNKYFFMLFTLLIGSFIIMLKNTYDERKKREKKKIAKQIKDELSKKGYDVSNSSSSSLSSSIADEDYEDSRNMQIALSSNSDPNEISNRSSSTKKSSKSNPKKINRSQSNEDDTKIENISGRRTESSNLPEVDEKGHIKIGKITYDPKQVIGHGCAGTFVYKGIFEKRPVAVKRILPECYTLADREVDLLRDADQHKNVLRYFCTESDSQFRYIALELCHMTLNEFVINKHKTLNNLNILEQATKGLDHLHSLDIAHRDIKPQNVLISFPDQKGQIFVMISDFGLCKRLELGNNSFSKKSGITGTDGWIAPELIEDDCFIEKVDPNAHIDEFNSSSYQPKRVTKAVDVFSLGCVYYFVLTGGAHPFGDSIRRQANILANTYKLDKLVTYLPDPYMQRLLIEKMISNDSKIRPLTKHILSHPIFWPKSKKLQFLQDVSDRLEKIETDDPIIVELEKNANVTIKNNWKTHLCPELVKDLTKFRTYNGLLLRDLLRVIRNKKHHYRELSPELKKSLGSLPDEFTDYFTSRFPKLILHVYEVMKCCSHENVIDVYYKINDNHF